ncbi:hypothetical protein Scep_022285 [Stephania cephalantha]|uniref:Uncharacterized protein n=1 Tax=Stephania cephalantha TaxID=152367 RepID=A0AAP0F541_9MAGN
MRKSTSPLQSRNEELCWSEGRLPPNSSKERKSVTEGIIPATRYRAVVPRRSPPPPLMLPPLRRCRAPPARCVGIAVVRCRRATVGGTAAASSPRRRCRATSSSAVRGSFTASPLPRSYRAAASRRATAGRRATAPAVVGSSSAAEMPTSPLPPRPATAAIAALLVRELLPPCRLSAPLLHREPPSAIPPWAPPSSHLLSHSLSPPPSLPRHCSPILSESLSTLSPSFSFKSSDDPFLPS